MRPGVDGEHVAEHVGRRHQQFRFIWYDPANVIGQTTVRIGNIGPALDHDDLSVLVQAPQPGGAGGTAGDSTNDNDFHASSSNLSGPAGRTGVPPLSRRFLIFTTYHAQA